MKSKNKNYTKTKPNFLQFPVVSVLEWRTFILSLDKDLATLCAGNVHQPYKKILPALMLALQSQGFVPACIIGNYSRRKALKVTMKRFGTK
jgi:hypothetical protein